MSLEAATVGPMTAEPGGEGLTNWKSREADEDDVEEFTKEEIANEPAKRILWAAENGKLKEVNEILASAPELVNSCDSDSYTPLHRAAYNNHEDVAKALICHNANLQAKTVDGWQPLHSAARWNSVETAQILIHSGAEVNAQTNGGLTPLHMAASSPDNGPIIGMLLSNPFIDISLTSAVGETARQVCERATPHSYLFEMVDDYVNKLFSVTESSSS